MESYEGKAVEIPVSTRCKNYGISAEDSCTHRFKSAQHSGCMCYGQRSCRDEAFKPFVAEMIPFHVMGWNGAVAFDVSPPEYCSFFVSVCPLCFFSFCWNGNDCSVSLHNRSRKLKKNIYWGSITI